MSSQSDRAWEKLRADAAELGRQSRATFLKHHPVMTPEQARKIFMDGLMEFAAIATKGAKHDPRI